MLPLKKFVSGRNSVMNPSESSSLDRPLRTEASSSTMKTVGFILVISKQLSVISEVFRHLLSHDMIVLPAEELSFIHHGIEHPTDLHKIILQF